MEYCLYHYPVITALVVIVLTISSATLLIYGVTHIASFIFCRGWDWVFDLSQQWKLK